MIVFGINLLMYIIDNLKMGKFRYERKFFITNSDFHTIELIIKNHPAMFSSLYHPRNINSIYFDTPGLSNYNDNVVGTSERIKARVRWYGPLCGRIEKPILEFKYKRAYLGTKVKYDLIPFELSQQYSYEYQQKIFEKSDVPEKVNEYLRTLQPYIIIRYYRRYYQSADRKFRITLDTDVEFYKITSFGNTFQNKFTDRNSIILELKCDEEDGNAVEYITNHLPFRLTKSSKYVSGIEKLFS